MSRQCKAEHGARYRETADACRIDADSLKREIGERDLLIMAQKREIEDLKRGLAAHQRLAEIPHSDGVSCQGKSKQIVALRRALLEAWAECGRKDAANLALVEGTRQLIKNVEELKAENARLAASDRYHNGPNAPPSQNSISAMQDKAITR